MSDFSGLYDIRDYKEEDKNFIISTFLKGLYYDDSWFSLIEKNTFMDNYKKVIEALIQKCVIKVACLKDEQDVIIAYSLLSQDFQTISWVYCKKEWRRKGIARSLLPKHPRSVSHLTQLGRQLLPKLEGAVFDPFKI